MPGIPGYGIPGKNDHNYHPGKWRGTRDFPEAVFLLRNALCFVYL